uniref:Uncharacterized protein n=1 Tax=Caenorhabditis japonica TaxID=281687 RepID=A0A8R1DFA5_CAEJA
MRKIMATQYGGDPTFMKKFLLGDSASPNGTPAPSNLSQTHCHNISQKVISGIIYQNCRNLSATSWTVLNLNAFTGFGLFDFVVNLNSLKNIEVKLEHQTELTYLYFSSFKECDTIKLTIRGNSQLTLEGSKTTNLKRVCHPDSCDIQPDSECHFRYPIRSSKEYQGCNHVYGDMIFTSRFFEVQPEPPAFVIDGCFIFNKTGIRFVRPFLIAHARCQTHHVFERNKYMCTDQIKELIKRWGEKKVKWTTDLPDVNCYQGECRGGFIIQRQPHRFVGCEIFKGDTYASARSGNISDRIRDLSNAHTIHGQLQLIDNPYVTDIPLPFLKSIVSDKCN